ncbi:MAG: UDP-N-acetylmuramate--L-alanine ligase, partial [Spirochaetaceae bacterium]|nr:UDP-N-acetylmuramate--L-alanine ligase [Spirochaetaceae bacterium]
GMCALAELFHKAGAIVSGSDTEETFYTDSILKQLGIKYKEGFSELNLDHGYDLVIHSAAYNRETNPDIKEAVNRKLVIMEYTEALGAYSKNMRSCGIAGVHGKTTTTGITGTLLKEMGLPVSVLAGSAISNFDGRSTFVSGTDYFIAETCEYKRHFLSFFPNIIIVTSIEPDHLDYFKDYNDIFSAFLSYAEKLPEKGVLIYCKDDKGANSLGDIIAEKRKDIKLLPYGIDAEGLFKVKNIKQCDGVTKFHVAGIKEELSLKVPGVHNVLNSAAAIAAVTYINSSITGNSVEEVLEKEAVKIVLGLENFKGSKRRSELLGTACGITFMDDYAHHPTAIETTLSGLKSFFPGKRIILDFMSHTYSRTHALMEEFSKSFENADVVIINKIYASAREKSSDFGDLNRIFFNKITDNHDKVLYYHEPDDAQDFIKKELKEGDLFITMGAGDNWKLGVKLYDYYKQLDLAGG